MMAGEPGPDDVAKDVRRGIRRRLIREALAFTQAVVEALVDGNISPAEGIELISRGEKLVADLANLLRKPPEPL